MIAVEYLYELRRFKPRLLSAMARGVIDGYLEQGQQPGFGDKAALSKLVQGLPKGVRNLRIGVIQRSVKVPKQMANRRHHSASCPGAGRSEAAASSSTLGSSLLTSAFSTR